ncbi:diguanylate cyclase domain-containing protein [Pseudomonas typographi]|uniref:diguanylate cyclase domain-containing protein n=1 Tax=Pseudomonas typographi TaxID=2715964 RepID=UPI001682259C|nr:diguanylate cyclase [Pseudomonas typographi]MBD1552540.1 diguanylate cyclase [Pseudomonas typographi]
MPTPHLSLLLVNDDKALRTPMAAMLQGAGYGDIRCCDHDTAARELELRPPAVVISAGQQGLALASQARQLDERHDRYTYVILIDERPSSSLLDPSADFGVDEVISPAQLAGQLLPRVHAADRLSHTLQRLQLENRLLRDNLANLEQRNQVDAVTGLGSARYLQQRLEGSLRQIEARGGALCYLLIGLGNGENLLAEHGQAFYDELVHAVGRRLQQMVRPLDTLARLDEYHFVLLTLPADLQECAPSSFKRLFDGLNQKGFLSQAGVIDIQAGVALVGVDAAGLPLAPQQLQREAEQLLRSAYASGVVTAKRLAPKAK